MGSQRHRRHAHHHVREETLRLPAWAFFDNYTDRVMAQCVNTPTPKWSQRLAGFDALTWDQC